MPTVPPAMPPWPQGLPARAPCLTVAKLAGECRLPGCSAQVTAPFFCCSPQHAQKVVAMMQAKGLETCRLLTCSKDLFRDAQVTGLYCGRTHKEEDKFPYTGVFEVARGSPVWQNVLHQLEAKWSTNHGPLPVVSHLYEIKPAQALLERFQKYSEKVAQETQAAYRGASKGNVQRRFHGTRRACQVGTKSASLCLAPGQNFQDTKCNICGILRNGFDKSFFGSAPVSANRTSAGWGRFGKGHYFTSVSSKTHSYNDNPNDKDNLRMIIMCNVVVGNGKKVFQDDLHRTAPPAGFHSVLGEVGGGNLNYDELCIYDDDAILPTFLIMYPQ